MATSTRGGASISGHISDPRIESGRRERIAPHASALALRHAMSVDLLSFAAGERRVYAEHSRDAIGVEIIAGDAKFDLESIDIASWRRVAGVARTRHEDPIVAPASRSRSRTCER